MIRSAVAFLLALCLLAGSLPASPQTRPAVAEPQDVDRRVAEQLDRELPEVNFDQNFFGDVMDFLRDVSGANIYVNWKALQDAGITPQVPISVKLRNITVRKALDVIVEDAGGATTKIAITIDRGVISIAPAASARRITRSYDVHDLIPEKAPVPPIVGAAIVPGLERPALGRADELVRLLTTSIAPSTWESNGGSIGSIKESDGTLVVTQTVENQEAIENWLTALRAIVKDANK